MVEARGRRVFEGDDPRNSGLRWHRLLAQITGGLSMSIGRGLSRAKLQEWANTLDQVAADMRRIAGAGTDSD